MTVTREQIRPTGFTIDIGVDVYMQLPLHVWRVLLLSLADGKCEHCKRQAQLHCHHIDEVKQNNCIANGMCLCVVCHTTWHYLNKDRKEVAMLQMQDKRLIYLKSLASEGVATAAAK